MFLCQPCHTKSTGHDFCFGAPSFGPCEICKLAADCSDCRCKSKQKPNLDAQTLFDSAISETDWSCTVQVETLLEFIIAESDNDPSLLEKFKHYLQEAVEAENS
jgi:hypothetical protein